jgi:trehalose-6-phosphate synthase
MPIEFILAHNGEEQEPGVLVLSEFVSSARVMQGAVKVNPWRADDVVIAIQVL